MTRTRLTGALTLAIVTGLGLLGLAAPAQATAHRTSAKHQGSPIAAPALAPSGYVIVTAGPITVRPHRYPDQQASCPTGKVPLGGGVYNDSTSTRVNVTEFDPDVYKMSAEVINDSSQKTSVFVYVICATKPKDYSGNSSDELRVDPHAQLNDATTTCPKGKPLSGGLLFNFPNDHTSINTSIPQGTGWRGDANNDGASVDSIQMSVLCGTLAGYHVVRGTTVVNPAGQQTGVRVVCGTGVPVGGGAYSSSTSTKVAINSSLPVSDGWTTYMNNGSASDAQVTPYVICVT